MTGSRPRPDSLMVLWVEVVALSDNDELIWGV